MITNAEDARARVQTLLYLLRNRYELDATTAGSKLCRDYSTNAGFQQLLSEVRAALETTSSLTSGTWCSDTEARQYLLAMLAEYDRQVQVQPSEQA